MIELTHRATGHQIKVDEQSAEFWQAAGYREADGTATQKAPARRRSTKKAAAKSSDQK